jgi:hypothetical protein
MIRQKTHLETKINDKEQIYICENDTSLTEALQGLDTFRSYIYGRLKEQEDLKQKENTASETEGK